MSPPYPVLVKIRFESLILQENMDHGQNSQVDATHAADIAQRLAMAHMPVARRPAVEAVLALDRALGQILRTTREPMIGQMRLTWWHGALSALDDKAPPAQPVLQGLATDALPAGVSGADLAAMVEGWEVLLEPDLDATALKRFAEERGGRLFQLLATIVAPGEGDRRGATMAGEGWALADLVPRLTDQLASAEARTLAEQRFDAAFSMRWPRRLRPLGTLALVARAALATPDRLPRPALAFRLIRHRLTGT
jgi:phytoene synthase